MGRRRDRHGRGQRGPGVLPRVPGQPELRTERERFDDLALAVITEIDDRWQERIGPLEYVVEDMPTVPPGWDHSVVPMAGVARGAGDRPTRLVIFRHPIERRCETRSDLESMLLTVVVEQIAGLLGVDPDQIDPRYLDEE